MLARIFHSNSIVGYALTYLFIITLALLSDIGFSSDNHLFLSRLIGDYTLIGIIMVLLLFPSLSIRYYIKNELHKKSAYYQFFLFLVCSFPVLIKENWNEIIILPVIVVAISKVMDTYNKKQTIQETFEIGLLIGLALLLDPITFFLIPFFLVSINIYRSFHIRDFLIYFLGVAFPSVFLYLIDLYNHFDMIGIYKVFFSSLHYQYDYKLTAILPGGILVIISLFNLFRRVNYLGIKQQLNRYVLMWLILFSIPLYLFTQHVLLSVVLISFSATVPLNYYLKHLKKAYYGDLLIITTIIVSLYFLTTS